MRPSLRPSSNSQIPVFPAVPLAVWTNVGLKKLVRSAREFFKSFEALNFKDLSIASIQKMMNAHHLAVPDLLAGYSKKLRNMK